MNSSKEERRKEMETERSYVPFRPNNRPPVTAVAVDSLSRVQLFATPWTVAHQAPRIKPASPARQADSLL